MGNDQGRKSTLLRNDFVAPAVRPYKTYIGGTDDPTSGFQGGLIDDPTMEDTQHEAGIINPQISLGVEVAEARFTGEELSKIQKEFERLSKDNVIGKRKLLEYFRLMEIQDTYLSNEIFFMIKNSSKLNSPVDYPKFINFVSIVAKGSSEEKLQLLYTFFDKNTELKITKEDLKAHISGTILSMQGVSMDLNDFEKLKQSIASAPEGELEQALDILVQDIFQTYSGNQEELSYDEWKRWFVSLEGVNEVLNQQNNSRPFGASSM